MDENQVEAFPFLEFHDGRWNGKTCNNLLTWGLILLTLRPEISSAWRWSVVTGKSTIPTGAMLLALEGFPVLAIGRAGPPIPWWTETLICVPRLAWWTDGLWHP